MDKEILEHYSSNSLDTLQEFLNKQKAEQLTSVLDQYALRGKGDPVLLLRAILTGSPVSRSEGIQRRYAVFKHVVMMLNTQDLNSKTSAEFLGVLLMETDTLPTSSLSGLIDMYIDAIKTGVIACGRALELFPKILATVASKEEVSVGEGQIKGSEYKSHVLNSICSSRWDSTTVIHLASMFKDVHLSAEEMSFVISKILRMMKEMDIQELPPLVYQLMLLANKGPKKTILDGIISFFVEKDLELKVSENQNEADSLNQETTSAEQLHHIEGTIILHISFAMKQDQELARQFIKYYKDIHQFLLGKALAPFTVAVALSTSDLMGFGDQVFELLKTTIYRSFKNDERCRESKWVNEMNQGELMCADLVLDTVKNSVVGWDHILQGLVRLGFILMESYGPKACFGRVTDSSSVGGRLSPAQKSCQLGAQILQESFKVHDVVRASIIEQLINHIVTKASSPVSQYIGLLTDLVKSCPQVLLSSVARLKEAFDYLTYLPLTTCESLLVAIQPLLRISVNLRDALFLVLRKAMFCRQLESRRVAASSFLMLISNFKLLGNLSSSQMSFSSQCSSFGSQIQMDVHSQRSRTMNESVCLEILGSLRRCLTQQADVRLILYEGLLNVSKSNPQLSSPVFSQLKAQFQKYYESDTDVNPPVKLEPCIAVQGEEIVTAEPLAHLLSSLVHCYLSRKPSQDDDIFDDDDALYNEVKEILDSLVLRNIKCEPEDFELDKSADYSTDTSVGVRNTILVLLVCGMYETMMEYCFLSTDFRMAGCEQMMKLFQNFKRLSDILKEKPTSAAAGGSKKGPSKTKELASSSSNTSAVTKNCGLLSLGFLRNMLAAFYNDDVPAHQEALALLRADVNMQRYFLTAATEKLSQIQLTGRCDGCDGRNVDRLFTYCSDIAKVLLKHYTSYLQSAGAENRPVKNRSVMSLCLETFAVSISVATIRYHRKLEQFLLALASSSINEKDNSSCQELLCKQIRKFQRMVITVLASNDEERSLKDVATLLNIIFTLTQCIDNDSKQLTEIQQWVLSLCKEQALDDIPISKLLITQLLNLSRQVCEALPIVHILAQDVHSLLGDIDQEVEMGEERTFAILNHRVAGSVIILLLHCVDKEVDDTEVVVNKLKANTSAPRVTDTQEENTDRSICVRLVHVINVFHELLQTVIPSGPAVENLLKVLHRLYTVLTNLVKWKLSLYTSNSGHISSRFEKLIKLTGNSLTQFVYSTITYIQVSQTEQLQQINEKGKKKNSGKKITSQPGKALILKETRSIPNLIYAIEQYEKYLIQLAKKSKIDLMSHFKMSTSRDFRINVAALQEALQSASEPEDEENEDDEKEENEGSGEENPPSKRIKTDTSVSATNKPSKPSIAASNKPSKALSTSSKPNTQPPAAASKGKKRLGKK